MRYPVAAGSFYPSNKELLIKTIENFLKNEKILRIFEENKSKKIFASIVPHAGYIYSGLCASSFYVLLKNAKYDTVIILGTNHTGLGEKISLLVSEDWKTPLGVIETDKEFGKELVKKGYIEDSTAHLYEHSIEVHLPFLQYVLKDFKLVPIVLKDPNLKEIKNLAKDILDISRKLDKNILVIASSDFTHHGEMYGYTIFKENINENVKKLDKYFIDFILKLDTEKFLEKINEKRATICGYIPISVVLEYSKLLNLKSKLLMYYTSSDITGEEDIIVGYSSIIFYKE